MYSSSSSNGNVTGLLSESRIRRLEPAQFNTSPDSTVIEFDAMLLVRSRSAEPRDGTHSALKNAVCEPAAVFNSAVQ